MDVPKRIQPLLTLDTCLSSVVQNERENLYNDQQITKKRKEQNGPLKTVSMFCELNKVTG